jgi:hypothetical protein
VNFKNTISLISIIFLCFTFGSCKKSKEGKITRTWEKIDVTTQTPVFVEYWKFESDGTVILYNYSPGGSILEVDRGTWHIRQKIDKSFVALEFAGHGQYNKEWRIHKLTKKIMIILLIEDGQTTMEFQTASI